MNPKVLVGCPTSDYKEECLEEYAEAVKNLSYDNYEVLLIDNSKGNEYFERGQWIEALKSYDRAIHLNPTYEKARLNKAIVLDKMGWRRG